MEILTLASIMSILMFSLKLLVFSELEFSQFDVFIEIAGFIRVCHLYSHYLNREHWDNFEMCRKIKTKKLLANI